MAIRLLEAWNGYGEGTVLDQGDAATEAALVSSGKASYSLAGGVNPTQDGDTKLIRGELIAGKASAASNLDLINKSIRSGGATVVDTGFPVYIASPIVVSDNQSLVTSQSSPLRMIDGGSAPCVVTQAYLDNWATVTVAWSSGKTATVTWAGHPMVLGDVMALQGTSGTTVSDWWRVFRVVGVTDANTFTIRLPFKPTAAPTGTLTAKRCNRNVRIDVAIDPQYGRNTLASGQNRMASIMAFVADSPRIRVRVSNDAYKYGMLLAGAMNVDAEVFGFPNTRSDTVKVYGPCASVRVRAHGIAGEDCASMQCLEPAAFKTYMPCEGNIDGVKFDRLDGTVTTAGSGPLVIYTDDTYSAAGIEANDGILRNLVAGGPAFRIMPGSGFATSSSKTKDITLRRMELNCSGSPAILVDSKIRKLTVDSCILAPSDSDTTACAQVTANGTVDVIEFANIDFEGGAWPVATRGHFLDVVGVARDVVFRRCTFRGALSYLRILSITAGATVENVLFENCEADSIDALGAIYGALATGSLTVVIRGGRYNAVPSGFNFKTTGCRLVIEGSPTFTNMNLGVARCDTASTTTEIVDRSNARYAGTTVPFAVLNGALVNLRGPNLAVDIGATGVNKATGNEAFNTTLRGTIPANVPVICDGTSWYNKCNLSQTF